MAGSRYRNRDPTLGELSEIRLDASKDGARIVVKGSSAGTFSRQASLLAQLVRDDGAACWQARFDLSNAEGATKLVVTSD